MENLVKKNNEMIDGILILKGNKDQLSNALVGVVNLLGYDIYHTEMLGWRIKNRMNRKDQISVPIKTDSETWKKIKVHVQTLLIATKEKAVAC